MKPHVDHQQKEDRPLRCRESMQKGVPWVMLRRAATLVFLALAVLGGPALLVGEEPVALDTLGAEYERDVRPLLKRCCLECHSTELKEGELDLEQFASFQLVRGNPQAWQLVDQMLGSGEMPPEDSQQLSTAQRKQLRDWVRGYLNAEAHARAGDPGPVVLRRLNNAEYTYTIDDLTGVGLDPTREFPADSASGEGFTNTGGALVMSPGLLKKYLDAGTRIARHAVLLPAGFRFSPHVSRRAKTDEILTEIRGFYHRFVESEDLGLGASVGYITGHTDTRLGNAGRLPLQKYFAATLAHRDALTAGDQTIEEVAAEQGLNSKYLGTLWSALSRSDGSLLLNGLRARWQGSTPEEAADLAAEVATWQRGLWTISPVGLIGRQGSSAGWLEPIDPLVTHQELRWKFPALEQNEPDKEVVVSLVVSDAGDGDENDYVVWQQPRLVQADQADILLRDVRNIESDSEAAAWGLDPALFGKHPNGTPIDAASLCVRAPSVITIRLPAHLAADRELLTTAVLEEQTGREGSVQVDLVAGTPLSESGLFPSAVTVTYSQVTQVFSEHHSVSIAKPILVSPSSAARAALQSAMDEHRSLFPAAACYTQIVPVDVLHTTTPFYREDDHLTRLMLDDRQKSQLDRLWEELHYVSQSALKRVVMLEDLLRTMSGDNPEKVSQYKKLVPLLAPIDQQAAAFAKALVDSEPSHLAALVEFAKGAYRRPLTELEATELRALYHQLRQQELSHDEAFRLTLAQIFVATPFLFRLENAPKGADPAAISAWELANRLSYFLWSSLPDDQLRAAVEQGRFHRLPTGASPADQAGQGGERQARFNAAELLSHTQRMLADSRVRRLATEFTCQWLDIHQFDQNDQKSETRFPEFAQLREEMHEEAIRFFEDMFRNNGSILDLLAADHMFVNESLARHYGIEGVSGPQWQRVEDVGRQGRGGVLAMAAILAKQSGASRTSPILRGNWVSETLLGERLPKPPANVPQLPESVPTGLTARQLIEQHSSLPECAKCHARIDPYGFALEQYDAIGRLRETKSDTKTQLVDGKTIEGIEGLRGYLLNDRRQDIVRQFCRKLLGYSLGRAVQLSDEPLLREIEQHLAAGQYRFGVAVERIVLSEQFQMIRGKSFDR